MTDKSWELLTKLLTAYGCDISEIEDEFDFDEICDRIKELKELKRQYKLSCLDCEYKNTKADVERYLKVLEEIKLLVTNLISSCNKCPDNKNGYCIGINECSSKCFKKLLDIINKAKGK